MHNWCRCIIHGATDRVRRDVQVHSVYRDPGILRSTNKLKHRCTKRKVQIKKKENKTHRRETRGTELKAGKGWNQPTQYSGYTSWGGCAESLDQLAFKSQPAASTCIRRTKASVVWPGSTHTDDTAEGPAAGTPLWPGGEPTHHTYAGTPPSPVQQFFLLLLYIVSSSKGLRVLMT